METIKYLKNRIFRLLNLCFVATLIAGCSSNDDGNSNTTIEALAIGVWKPVKFVEVCSTGTHSTENYDSCEQNGRLTINANGTFSGKDFYEDFNAECKEVYTYGGTWSIKDNILLVTIEGDMLEMTFFEVSANLLRIGEYEDGLGYTCDGDNVLSHYYTEYIKI